MEDNVELCVGDGQANLHPWWYQVKAQELLRSVDFSILRFFLVLKYQITLLELCF
jgi:hypothetical protein